MANKFTVLGFVLSSLGLASTSWATPPVMGYSGRLLDAEAAPLTGTYTFVFRLFAESTAGVSLFEETHAAQNVRDGNFTVLLNEVEASTTFETLFATHDTLYLEIEVGGEVLLPRQRLASVPWSLGNAASTQFVPGATCSCDTGYFVEDIRADGSCTCAPDQGGSGGVTTLNGFSGAVRIISTSPAVSVANASSEIDLRLFVDAVDDCDMASALCGAGHGHSQYSLAWHDHGSTYAYEWHQHDGDYSPAVHNHDGWYAPATAIGFDGTSSFIGASPSTKPAATLWVARNTRANHWRDAAAITAMADDSAGGSGNRAVGVYGTATGSAMVSYTAGLWGEAFTGWSTFGVIGLANQGSSANIGVYGSTNYYSWPSGNWAGAFNDRLYVGDGTEPSTAYNLTVNGTAGKPGGGTWSEASDARLKRHIAQLDAEEALTTIAALRGVTFEWANPDQHATGVRAGVVAQELETVFPSWVQQSPATGADRSLVPAGEGVKTVSFPNDFNAYLIESIKALKSRNDQLAAHNSTLQRRVDALEVRLLALERAMRRAGP